MLFLFFQFFSLFSLEDGYPNEIDFATKTKPASNDQDKISKEVYQHKQVYFHPKTLLVSEVLQPGIILTDNTRFNHIYEGRGILTKHEAIHFSANRNSNILINIVFEKPDYFKLCRTDDSENPFLTISNRPVQAFQCFKSNSGKLEAHDLRKVYAIFSVSGSHFLGYLYRNIKWPLHH
jgi:hypothetical protein